MKTNLFIRIAICAIFVFALCTATFAASDLTLSVGEDANFAGNTVDIPISISGNTGGFGGMEFSVSFDSAYFTLTEIDVSGALAAFTITPIDIANSEGRVDFTFVNDTADNITGNGDIATLTFEIAKKAEPMISPLHLYVPTGIAFRYENNAMADLDITPENGAITVSKTPEQMLYELGIRIPNYNGDDSATITKFQFALLLAQVVSGKTGLDVWGPATSSEIFGDVAKYGKAIDYLYKNGYISGRTKNTFGVGDSVKYQDALVIAVRMLGYESADLTYPGGYTLAANRLELTNGITTAYTSNATVKDAFQLVWNMFNTEFSIKDPMSGLIVYPGEDSLWETTTGKTVERSTFAEVYFYKTHGCTFDDWTVSVPATPATYGEECRTCMVCGKEETRLIPMLDMPDANGDGVITVLDIMLVLDAAVNDKSLPEADVNGDGKITLTDVIKIVVLASE